MKENAASSKISVLLADDHPIVRSGLKSELKKFPNINICGEASSGRETIDKASKLHPDVVLLDITMPDMNGLEATKILREHQPSSKIIALTMHENKNYILEMIRLGASGYVLKDSEPGELVKAIEAVNSGKSYFSSNISDKVMDIYSSEIRKNKKPFVKGQLTPRENEVLLYIVKGCSNKEIASLLNVSVRTVETHRDRIMSKLNIHSVAGLTRYAISEGLIEL
ncbi:MAG: DNA-binding response regulator [Ignavibacteriae bacterium]|nr:MAG: DNA-binding response regulator [Ignavibacteriota bacterium]